MYNLSTNYLSQAIEGMKWFLFKKGMLTYSHLEVGGFVKTSEEYKHPNIQLHFFPSLVINHGLTNPSFDGFQLHAYPNRPKSRGFVKLRSPNSREDPIINVIEIVLSTLIPSKAVIVLSCSQALCALPKSVFVIKYVKIPIKIIVNTTIKIWR